MSSIVFRQYDSVGSPSYEVWAVYHESICVGLSRSFPFYKPREAVSLDFFICSRDEEYVESMEKMFVDRPPLSEIPFSFCALSVKEADSFADILSGSDDDILLALQERLDIETDKFEDWCNIG